ncbi:MAG: polyprenyl synthetase family protein [Rhodospirillales bacterium]|nr:polyprenyl synthetase family protein [Rhodospirillales bacterium]
MTSRRKASGAAAAIDRKGVDKPSLSALDALVADDLRAVNQTIIERMHSPVQMIPQLAGHVVAAGGKRLRPMLTLAAAKLCGYSGRRQIGLATCVEFIHTATLLHDDVVDDSSLRRGLASANAVWGNKSSVLVGDFLFSRSFELMVEDGSLDVLRILSSASSTIAEGEVMQLLTTSDLDTDEDAYLSVIRAKTAELFAAACEIGAVVADRPPSEAAALRSYGMNFGIAFQLIDDVLDYSAAQVTLGKSIGDDFRDGKVTLPVVLAYRRGDRDEQAFWRRAIADMEQKPGDLDRAIGLLTRHDALGDAVERARTYGRAAEDAMGVFPDGAVKQVLTDLIDFCVERAY